LTNLKIDLRVGETSSLDNGRVVLTLLEKSGQRARFDIQAEEDVKIATPRASQAATIAKQGLTVKT
jgi:hypothetical protein